MTLTVKIVHTCRFRITKKNFGPLHCENLQELEISRICLKFNRAWLAESHPTGPEIAEAMSEYISMQEECCDSKPWVKSSCEYPEN